MKPITFESIRNFLKTKKKNKKDGADTSFKRSDSFKRISIRKSYLDRGRKRASRQQQKSATAVTATSNGPHFKESEVKNGIFVGRPLFENKRSHSDDQESDGFCLKNKSLQEINELCAADDIDDIICDTEVQTIAINFQGGNSTESIYNELNNDVISNSPIDAFQPPASKNISQISISLDDTYDSVVDEKPASISSPHSSAKQKLNKIIENDDDHKSPRTNNLFFLFGENVYDRADSVNGSAHRNRLSSFDRSNTQRSDDTGKRTLDYRSSFDKRSLQSPVSPSEMPSLVTFKTYCEPTKYLETSFDSIEPRSINHSLESQRSNVSKTSLNCEALPLIDSQTFRLPKKYKAEKVVIRIPATTSTDCSSATEAIAASPPYAKQNLGKQVSNDSALDVDVDEDFENISANIINEETSDNGKFTFEIYRELQKTRDIKRPAPQRFLAGTSIEIASTNIDAENDAGEYQFDQHNFRSSDDIETYGHQSLVSFQCSTLEEPFRSLQIDDQSSTNNFYCEEAEPVRAYNNYADIISPHSSIPYPLRIKTNPFSRQKELYSVNLGRIWKQLNLGQEDDMSLEATSMQGNFKLKNESFKSMSSRDSGFSLTLTKPSKSLFRRKSKKNRRKPKLAISRDGYFKRVMVVQRVSSRRKKKRSAPAKMCDTDAMFEQNFYETLGQYYRDTRRRQQYTNDEEDDAEDARNYYDNDLFMREFEEFCVRRNRSKSAGIPSDRYKSKNFDEFLKFNNADNFTQEISDLEAFFEEHLKRLKEYYLQKKKLNEQTINELYKDYDDDDEQRHHHGHTQRLQPGRVQEGDPVDEYEDVYSLATNDTLNRKQRYTSAFDDAVDNFKNASSVGLEFQFPHPDKRRTATSGSANSRGGGDSKKRGKFKTQEVRDFSAVNDHLKYASLEFSNGQVDGQKSIPSSISVSRDSVAYADLQFPAKEFLEFPYGKLKSNENRRMSRRKISNNFQETAVLTPAANNISLSSIFPSISDTCQMCHKLRKNPDMVGVESASDEFSENEFIANSIGCEMCLNCDKLHSDCDCSLTMNEKLANRKHSINANSKWCTCVSGDSISAPIAGGALLSSSPNSCFTQNKRKVKRKKSKRRLGKNHSTLRREYTLSYNTSKFVWLIFPFTT